ncbi:hypothetical protein HanIR_Chr16g0804971 [Helianthus annuus]|nr:hypothetical protein HanIR_Chr16g0804971 [Helianthus annuus]
MIRNLQKKICQYQTSNLSGIRNLINLVTEIPKNLVTIFFEIFQALFSNSSKIIEKQL